MVARLSVQLAAKEAADGKTSPYLLPVIEQLAQAHLLGGGFAEARALRRRALDIAIARGRLRFGDGGRGDGLAGDARYRPPRAISTPSRC